jgi:hypothetical protein
MTVTVVRSTDAGAPALDGTAGSLKTVLDYALALLGWSVAFTGTNKSAYLQGAGSSNFYFRLLDDASGADTGKAGLVRGYESMSDVDTGSNPCPTVAQLAAGITVRKSNTADGTQRAWSVYGDPRTAVIAIDTGDTANKAFCAYMGDYEPFAAGDAYCCGIMGNYGGANQGFPTIAANPYVSQSGHYIFRNYASTVGAVVGTKCGFLQSGGNMGNVGGLGSVPYSDGATHMCKVLVGEYATSPYIVRGWLRGVYAPQHTQTGMPDHRTTILGPSGETLECIQFYSQGFCLIPITGSWA